MSSYEGGHMVAVNTVFNIHISQPFLRYDVPGRILCRSPYSCMYGPARCAWHRRPAAGTALPGWAPLRAAAGWLRCLFRARVAELEELLEESETKLETAASTGR
jgi:hypothetical protein